MTCGLRLGLKLRSPPSNGPVEVQSKWLVVPVWDCSNHKKLGLAPSSKFAKMAPKTTGYVTEKSAVSTPMMWICVR